MTVEPRKPFEGRSFADALRNSGGEHRDYAVTGCHIGARDGIVPQRATTPFLVTERWGYAPVGADGTPELFDLSVDALAENNIAADNAGLVAELHEMFMTHLVEHNAPEHFLALWRELPSGEGRGTWSIDYPDESDDE